MACDVTYINKIRIELPLSSLCAMSGDELCNFWCLFDREEEPFLARGGLEWNVQQWKRAIQQEKNGLDTSQIVFWKVRISFSPADVRVH